MPAATVSFSYAQAAKGQKTTSGSTSPAPSSSVDPVASTPMSGTLDADGKDASVSDVPASAAPTTDARNGALDTIRDSKAETVAAKAPSVSDASCTTNNDTLVSSGTSFNDSSRRDDDTGSELSAQRSVKGPRSQGPGPRAAHSRPTSTGADSKRQRRERKPKGGANGVKNAEKDTDAAESPKEAPPPPKVELFEAPIPTVNPWHQRLASQPSTTKSAASQPTTVSVTDPVAAPAQTTARKGSAAAGGQAKPVVDRSSTNGVGSQRRGGDGDAPRKSGPNHKNDSRRAPEHLASNDSAHWPTPDTISKEEKPQKSADKSVENQEAAVQDDQAPQKGKQPKKDWVKMDFVPSVNFETPLPQHKGARPRGGARGGRDGTTRGGHSSNAAKEGEKGNSSASASAAKVNGEAREGTRDVTAAHNQGSSVPPTSAKRGSTDAPAFRDQRKHAAPAAAKTKESAVNDQPREKHDARGDRPRGAPRGRGGYHASTSQLNAQHAPFTTGYAAGVAARQQNPYSPPIRQNQFNSYGSGSARGGGNRGGRAGANAARASGSNGNGRHAQSSVMTYDHSFHGGSMMGYPQAPSPAFFFDPYLVSTLTAQLSWYFSIQNLCRDMYLRSNMDSQGFVPLSLVASFNRVSTLLQAAHDPVQYVRQACMASRDVEFVVGDDGVERLRTLNNYQHWILPMEDRCESARTNGPATFFGAGQQYPAGQQGVAHGGYPSGGPAPMNYPPYGEAQNSAFASPASPDHGPELVNGHPGGHSTEAGQNTALKPTVAEFSPRNGAADSTKDQVVEGTDLNTSAEGPADPTPATVEVSENGQEAVSS